MLRALIASMVLVCAIVVQSSYAGEILSSKSLIVFAYTDRPSVSASIRMEADFVSMPLSIRGDHKDPAKRFEIIAHAKGAIIKAAEDIKDIQVHSGPVALSSQPVSKVQAFSSGGYGGTSQAEIHILSPLAGAEKDVFKRATVINNFIRGVRLPDGAEVDFGQIHLAVDNPEQYREALLRAIADEVAKTKSTLGSSVEVTVSGLESPVFVRQADEKHVDLFLSYELAMVVNK